MSGRHIPWLLSFVTLGALAPFLNKAYDIDDPLFLWMAQQIRKHPFDPYGGTVHWSATAQPMWIAMQNPPLSSYYLAAVGSVAGFGEIAMHMAFLVPAIAAVLGTFALARRLCPSPATAALLTLFTPVFLISATHVMCDVMLLAFWTWSIHCWLAGLERGKWHLFLIAALLVSAATLTKYFGISLVPLLLVYTLVKERRACAHLVFLAIPLLAAVAFELMTKAKYGHPLFSSAMLYLRDVASEVRIPLQTKFLTGCSFLGGCMIGGLFVVASRSVKAIFWSIGTLIVVGLFFWFCVQPAGANPLAVRLQGSLFASLGVVILALAFWEFWENRDADSLLLLLWIVGTFAFATFLNWSITARTILPMAPAVFILLLRRCDRGARPRFWSVSAALIVSMIITSADASRAGAARTGARHFRNKFGRSHTRVWFQSHWGFQWYMERWKARPVVQNARFRPHDILIIPSDNADPLPLPDSAVPLEEISRPIMPLVSTFAPGTGAGFYSSVRGPIPWAIARTAPERFQAFTLRDPDR